MNTAKLANVLKFFGGGVPTDEERKEIFKEALLMTLSRATSADTNIDPVEVASVIQIMHRETGETISEADVRVAAASELYETAPLDQYLVRMSQNLGSKDRARILKCLGEVVVSDVRISPREVEFFNWIAKALAVTPADLVDLRVEA
jgi:uncharacterized tellurite resistance protein B-like protein